MLVSLFFYDYCWEQCYFLRILKIFFCWSFVNFLIWDQGWDLIREILLPLHFFTIWSLIRREIRISKFLKSFPLSSIPDPIKFCPKVKVSPPGAQERSHSHYFCPESPITISSFQFQFFLPCSILTRFSNSISSPGPVNSFEEHI